VRVFREERANLCALSSELRRGFVAGAARAAGWLCVVLFTCSVCALNMNEILIAGSAGKCELPPSMET